MDDANALVLLISQDVSEYRGVSLVPVDYPQMESVDFDLTRHVRTALEMRPDFAAAKRTVERNNIVVKFNRNQLWPEIDLVGSYGLNGRGPTFNRLSDSTVSGDNPAWSVGVMVTIPLGNRQARATYHQSKLQVDQSLISLKQL